MTPSIQCRRAEYHYAECRDYLNVMLSVFKLSVFKLNVIMLRFVAPQNVLFHWPKHQLTTLFVWRGVGAK
jgi:hypothetical protein